MSIADELAERADSSYQSFQAKLVPTVANERILGVRMPVLRAFARTLWQERPHEVWKFLRSELPHATYDEMNLHGLLIGYAARTPSEGIELLEQFLPHVDNWATSDLIKVPAFDQDPSFVLEHLHRWMCATGPHTEYVVRCSVIQLMERYLGDAFEPEQLSWVANITRPEYYINMARAWYFSFALIKQPTATLPLFERHDANGNTQLDAWTHNKALQKARESRRLSTEMKAYLQSLKVPAHKRS